ncbi:MAG: hypothetical protein ACI9O3_001438 [Colwellia sp.]|jgi:hypothetical protein
MFQQRHVSFQCTAERYNASYRKNQPLMAKLNNLSFQCYKQYADETLALIHLY